MGLPLYVICFFSLIVFNILSLVSVLVVSMIICHGVVLFWSSLSGVLKASFTWMDRLWVWLRAGVQCSWGGILLVRDSARGCGMSRQRGRYPGGVWIWLGLGSGMAEGRVSRWLMDPAWPKRWGSCCGWIHWGSVVWCHPRGGKPGRMEQQLWRPTGWGFGRPAVLLLDHCVEKPSTI
jgi:hypothetical protein